jgi:hypothetical protein
MYKQQKELLKQETKRRKTNEQFAKRNEKEIKIKATPRDAPSQKG